VNDLSWLDGWSNLRGLYYLDTPHPKAAADNNILYSA
jgi:hypothetical protein